MTYHVLPCDRPHDVRTFAAFFDAADYAKANAWATIWIEYPDHSWPLMDINERGTGYFRSAPNNTVAHTPPFCERMREEARAEFYRAYEAKLEEWGAYWAQRGIGQ